MYILIRPLRRNSTKTYQAYKGHAFDSFELITPYVVFADMR